MPLALSAANPGAPSARATLNVVSMPSPTTSHCPGSGSPNLLLYEGFIGSAAPPPQPTEPGAPTLNATASTGQVALSWSVPSGTSPFTYTVYKGTASGQETTTLVTGLSTTSFVDTSVINGVTYWYQVSATNSVKEGTRSAEKSATPQAAQPPGARSGVSAGEGAAGARQLLHGR